MNTWQYKVKMTCSGCSGAVERALKRVDNTTAEISLEDQLVTVKTDKDNQFIFDVISKTGKQTEKVQ